VSTGEDPTTFCNQLHDWRFGVQIDSVFAIGSVVGRVRGGLTAAAPCGQCLLLHWANTAADIAAIRRASTAEVVSVEVPDLSSRSDYALRDSATGFEWQGLLPPRHPACTNSHSWTSWSAGGITPDFEKMLLVNGGPVTICDEIASDIEGLSVWYCRFRNPLFALSALGPILLDSFGVSRSPRQARLVALSESLERYVAFSPTREQVTFGRLPDTVAARVVTLTPRGVRVTRSSVAVEGKRVFLDESTSLSTVGCATHPSRPEALRSSYLEILEKVALMGAWEGLPGMRLVGEGLLARLLRRFDSLGIGDVAVRECSPWSGVSVVYVLARGIVGESGYVIGSAADQSQERAASKAVLEMLGSLAVLRRNRDQGSEAVLAHAPPAIQRWAWFSRSENLHQLERLVRGADREAPDAVALPEMWAYEYRSPMLDRSGYVMFRCGLSDGPDFVLNARPNLSAHRGDSGSSPAWHPFL